MIRLLWHVWRKGHSVRVNRHITADHPRSTCTWKSWHKPNRRYPNVYADMMYQRIRKAEARMGYDLQVLWDIRRNTLPRWARLEDNPYDLGLHPTKQNWYRETGQVHYLHHIFPDMEPSGFESLRELRKDPKW